MWQLYVAFSNFKLCITFFVICIELSWFNVQYKSWESGIGRLLMGMFIVVPRLCLICWLRRCRLPTSSFCFGETMNCAVCRKCSHFTRKTLLLWWTLVFITYNKCTKPVLEHYVLKCIVVTLLIVICLINLCMHFIWEKKSSCILMTCEITDGVSLGTSWSSCTTQKYFIEGRSKRVYSVKTEY